MKIKFLMTGFLALASLVAFAQNREVSNAQDNYNNYDVAKNVAALSAKATSSLNDAKTSIDKAADNPKTANLPLTFALKGAIYSALALRDTVAATSAPLLAT